MADEGIGGSAVAAVVDAIVVVVAVSRIADAVPVGVEAIVRGVVVGERAESVGAHSTVITGV